MRKANCGFIILVLVTGCASIQRGELTSRSLALLKNAAYTSGVGEGYGLVNHKSAESLQLAVSQYDSINEEIVNIRNTLFGSYTVGDLRESLVYEDPIIEAALVASAQIVAAVPPESFLDSDYTLNSAQRDLLANWMKGIADGLDLKIEMGKRYLGYEPDGG
jgi:hypothetical protein